MVLTSQFPDLDVPVETFPQYAFSRILKLGAQTSVVDIATPRSITWKEIHDQARRCASSLFNLGLKKGDVVAICAPNCVEYAVILLAVTSCGATLAAMNPGYKRGEIVQQFNISEPRMVICDVGALEMMRQLSCDLKYIQKIIVIGKSDELATYDDLLKNGTLDGFPSDIEIDHKEDVALLLYSSGTTGLPKSVMVTHYNLVSTMISIGFQSRMSRDSCLYSIQPMFHGAGILTILLCMQTGSMFVTDRSFDVDRMLGAVEEYKVTHCLVTPPMMISLSQAELSRHYDTSSLEEILWAGASCAPKVVTTLAERFDTKVGAAYGLTELFALTWGSCRKASPGSAGKPCVNCKIRIIDVQTGEDLGANENGEVLAKTPQMTKGYLKNSEATNNTIDEDGWFHTGDLGSYDANGMLYIAGRLKEVIKYKSFQVPPAELEAVLFEHPMISDVAVLGIADEYAGEIPRALVVKNVDCLSAEDVIGFVKERLADYKQLRGGVQFVESIPKNATGKVARRELAEMVNMEENSS